MRAKPLVRWLIFASLLAAASLVVLNAQSSTVTFPSMSRLAGNTTTVGVR